MIAEEVAVPPRSCVVYTPRELAMAMVKALVNEKSEDWLEPSCGDGVFVECLLSEGVQSSHITAVDVDRSVRLKNSSVRFCQGVDFLSWSLNCGQQFDKVIGNPPYVRIGELPEPLRQTASAVQQLNGSVVGLRANCWLSFLCASLWLLRDGGSLGLVLPASWDFADYAKSVREEIGKRFKSVHVYRCLRPLFSDVEEGSVVLIGKGWGQQGGTVERTEYKSPADLIAALEKDGGGRPFQPSFSPLRIARQKIRRLGEVMTVKIGAVTGDSSFFVMNEARRRALGLPKRSCVPILSKDRHLLSAVAGPEQWRELLEGGEKIWLFSPRSAQVNHPAIRDYLALAEEVGGCRREGYKVSNRDPWFQTRMPTAPHGFISGHSASGPWLALKRMPSLNATNTLYVVRFIEKLSDDEMASWGLSLMSSFTYRQWDLKARVYAAGLRKMEPGDLMSLSLPRPAKTLGATKVYVEAVRELLKGKLLSARRIADTWLQAS